MRLYRKVSLLVILFVKYTIKITNIIRGEERKNENMRKTNETRLIDGTMVVYNNIFPAVIQFPR